MTLKMTIQLSADKYAVAYLSDNAYVLTEKSLIEAKSAKAISVFSDVRIDEKHLVRVQNNVILNVKSVEPVDQAVVSYIPADKIDELTMPVICVFIPNAEPSEKTSKEFKLYFAMMKDC